MLENIVDTEADARDVIDALNEMIGNDVRENVRYKLHSPITLQQCPCCGGTGVEGIYREALEWPTGHGQGWANPPAICESCNGEGNYIISNDKVYSEEPGDAGWY